MAWGGEPVNLPGSGVARDWRLAAAGAPGVRRGAWLEQAPGVLALGLMLLVSGGAFLALASVGDVRSGLALFDDPWFMQVLRFTFLQAFLSATLAVLVALPVARAVALDGGLPGRATFLRLCLLCFAMPSLVLVTGLVVMFGRNGWVTPLLGEGWQLYGLTGVLLAHVYLNAPFAVRVLSHRWQAIPPDAWKIAAQLGLVGWQRFRLVEWPMLRAALPAAFGFIFLLCFNSFAVVLALGGGPRATTLEVAIFQALKYDFNPPEALALALLQLVCAGGLFLLLRRLGGLSWLVAARPLEGWRPQLGARWLWTGRVAYVLFALALLLPVLSLVPRALGQGLGGLPWGELGRVAGVSLLLGLASAVFALFLALAALAWWRVNDDGRVRRIIEVLALHQLVVPGMVLSVGLYVLLLPHLDWTTYGWAAVVLVNALIALPFVFGELKPRIFEYDANYRHLLADLGLHGWAHWRQVLAPFLGASLGRVLAIAFVLALGDFAVVGVFGGDGWRTLPWMIHALAGSYRLAEAAFAALLLLALAALALRVLERRDA